MEAVCIMTKKEKIGVGVIIGVFVALGIILLLTLRPVGSSSGGAEDSYFVQKRVQTLQN